MPTDLQFEIGAYDPATRTVEVTFTQGEIVHKRSVNACHNAAGRYDAEATAQRVEEVARGVAHKIALGVITNAPPEEVETEPEAEPVETAESPA